MFRAGLSLVALGSGLCLAVGVAFGHGVLALSTNSPKSSSLADQPAPAPFQPPAPGAEDLAAYVRRSADRVAGDAARDAQPSTAGGDEAAKRLTKIEVSNLAAQCAPATPASALVSIARIESSFAPLTIRVNGAHARIYHPASATEAASLAHSLIAERKNIDLGLAQINARNLEPLGLTVESAFDPCRSLAAAGEILGRGYERALRVNRANRPILQMAYSIYNTGNTEGGFFNGYAAKVTAASR